MESTLKSESGQQADPVRTRAGPMWSRQVVNGGALILTDALSLWASLYMGNLVLYWVAGIPIAIRYSVAILPTWAVLSFFTGLVPAWGLGTIEEFRRIQWQLAGVFVLAALAFFFSREYVLPSRLVYVVSYLVGTAAVPLARLVPRRLLAVRGWWGCPIVIYGRRASVARLASRFEREHSLGYIPAGYFSDDESGGEKIELPRLGSLRDASREAPIAVVDLAAMPAREMARWLDGTLAGYRKVILIPDLDEDFLTWVTHRTLGGLIGLEVGRNLLRPWAHLLKRSMDVAMVLVTLPAWLPLMALLALIIWLGDRKSPFYLQRRLGRGIRPFHAVKFRTMIPDAEKILPDLLAADPALREEWARSFKLESDPRVTPVGRLLRRHSLDELPQLINVLAGDMSLVGPRPLPEYHHEAVSADVRSPRARVQPGMTGLWQVSGRSELDIAEMEQWDTFYVRNWSIWLDLIILARTVPLLIRPRGAY